ncbi:MAG: oxygen-independent coproporphyrinogen III oxidase [Myxococcales bacterium]|nr:oxygen-independent coproporphyrinogen III oxidase [Myxococcales bacterium]
MNGEAFALDLDRVEAILPRYTTEGPRYTSYPTAPVWKEAYGPEQYRADLGREGASAEEGLSLYVHVPFCRSLCHFCACNRVITRKEELPVRFLDAIEREVAAVREAIRVPRTATQQHWGGGTPTHLTPDQVTRLFRIVTDAFPMREGAEISIEVDPRVTTEEHVAALRECGFNRISMGLQDVDPHVQEAIHRIQPAEQTAQLVEWSRSAGFESVNFDLIYGLPYQTEESFARTLDVVIGMQPDRIALYSYAHVTWVAKQQRGFERKDLPDPSAKARIMLGAIRRFLEEGYRFIGLDHFARPEDELSRAVGDRTLRRNFMGYTTQAGVDLLGFGPSAISELRESYAQSFRDLDSWQPAAAEHGLATMRGHHLSQDDVERRWIIGRIMCHGELRAEEFEATFGHVFAPRYARELEQLGPVIADGLVTRAEDGSLCVTPLGRLLVRNVAMVFDAYLGDQRKSGKPLFSKTV